MLDLSGVGMQSGVQSMEEFAQIRSHFPDLQLTTGGGIRTLSDLQNLRAQRADGVLIASALHQGMITKADLETLEIE